MLGRTVASEEIGQDLEYVCSRSSRTRRDSCAAA
jgi:hypothetical protein